jgi:hypothetical protein
MGFNFSACNKLALFTLDPELGKIPTLLMPLLTILGSIVMIYKINKYLMTTPAEILVNKET